MTIESVAETVISRLLFKVEMGMHGQLEKGRASDAKRKESTIQIMSVLLRNTQPRVMQSSL